MESYLKWGEHVIVTLNIYSVLNKSRGCAFLTLITGHSSLSIYCSDGDKFNRRNYPWPMQLIMVN